jgi:anti-sigma factor RsiW
MPALDDTLLMAFADGELDAATADQVKASIAHDPDALEKVRQFRQSTQLLRELFDQPQFRRMRSGPPEVPVLRGKPRSFSWPSHSLIAASMALFLLGMGAGAGVILVKPGPSFSERLLDEVADYHVLYARESEHQVEVSATRVAHIETWLGNRLHRTLEVPDLSARGLTFVGARLLSVDGAPVAQLLYQAPGREHEPMAFCIAEDKSPDAAARGEEYNGLQEVTWSRSGYSYVLAGWESQDFLQSLASELAPKLDRTL